MEGEGGVVQVVGCAEVGAVGAVAGCAEAEGVLVEVVEVVGLAAATTFASVTGLLPPSQMMVWLLLSL